MNKGLEANVSILINSRAFKIWKAVTDPIEIAKYFFGTKMESTLEVGSPITFSGEWEGKPYQDKGIILENIPEHTLKYTYWSSVGGTPDLPENYANVTYKLVEENAKTTLSIIQDGLKDEEGKKKSEENWNYLLSEIKKLVETE